MSCCEDLRTLTLFFFPHPWPSQCYCCGSSWLESSSYPNVSQIEVLIFVASVDGSILWPPFWMAISLMILKHKIISLFDPVIILLGTYTLGMIVHMWNAVFVCFLMDDYVSKNNNRIYYLYLSIRNYLNKFCASMKSNSKLLLEFCSEDIHLLTWKDAHAVLLSEKYSIYHMIPIICNYIRISPFLRIQTEMSERQMGN